MPITTKERNHLSVLSPHRRFLTSISNYGVWEADRWMNLVFQSKSPGEDRHGHRAWEKKCHKRKREEKNQSGSCTLKAITGRKGFKLLPKEEIVLGGSGGGKCGG